MKVNIILNYYIDEDSNRQEELNFCLLENLNNTLIDNFLILVEKKHYDKLSSKILNNEKILFHFIDKRPSYLEYFNLINNKFQNESDYNILINSDIIISEELVSSLKNIKSNKKFCFCLTRYNIFDKKNYKENCKFYNSAMSQDTWIFNGKPPIVKEATYTMGLPGCDNSIAYYLEKYGVLVSNPSKTLKTYHLHISGVKHYTSKDRVPNPIKKLPPKLLEEILV